MQQFLAEVSNGSKAHKCGSSLDVIVNVKQGGESVTALEITCRTFGDHLTITVWDSVNGQKVFSVDLPKD